MNHTVKQLSINDYLISSFFVATTQTQLSLPPVLPKHVEDVLRPYLRQTEHDHEHAPIETNRELYEKLFEYNEQHTPGSHQSSPAPSVGLSPIELSPLPPQQTIRTRNSGSFCNSSPLPECDLSSIDSLSPDIPREKKSATRLYFSSHMSVDSLCVVPDEMDQLPSQKSLMFGE